MSFIRHVGKHGDRKIAVIFREVPGEPHMCLVTYTETLNQHVHDPMMKCIESDIGQSSENLADALNRTFAKDGRPILQVLHSEGQMKKVNTELVIMTPQPNTRIKLSELNKILDEMKQGEEAVKKLADLDKSMGLQDPRDVARRMRNNQKAQPASRQAQSTASDVLGDNQLANNLRQQAEKMAAEAKGLLAESDRLLKEAAMIDPVKPVAETKSKTKTTATKTRKTRSKVTV
jgi:hypothetical protein